MGKVNANLADVNTTYVPIAAGDREMKVAEVTEQPDGVVVVRSVVDEAGEEYGKPVFDRINFKKKDGGENRWAKVQTKKYFEAICGAERANSEDIDWDEIKNGRFRGVIGVQEYESKKTPGKMEHSNTMEDILPL